MAHSYVNDFGGASTSHLNRSSLNIAARPTRYTVDGVGRDSYIARNNGGLYAKYNEAACASLGTF
jgi:hypothetical protein